MYHSTYYGVFIYRNTNPAGLRWITISPSFAADTLEGIRYLIRKSQGKQKA